MRQARQRMQAGLRPAKTTTKYGTDLAAKILKISFEGQYYDSSFRTLIHCFSTAAAIGAQAALPAPPSSTTTTKARG